MRDRYRVFAETILRDYRLDQSERDEEVSALAEVIRTAAGMQLENLEHRKK